MVKRPAKGSNANDQVFDAGLKKLIKDFHKKQLDNPVEIPKDLLDACDNYTRMGARNRNLTCENGLMARSGVEYLRSFIPDTSDVPGLAKLRVLDSFTLTDGPRACEVTTKGDGRHFYGIDFVQIRSLAEGTLAVLGEAAPGAVTGKAALSEYIDDGVFLTSPKRTLKLAHSLLLGSDYNSLLRRAFGGRHVAFIGDSTTACMHHQLVSQFVSLLE